MSYYHARRAFGNEDVIYKARQYERAVQERVKSVRKYETLMRYAQFEQLNGPRSSQRSRLAEKLAAVRGEREQALLHRRRKLSVLLTAEDTMLQNEIKTGSMNLSERRAWLLSRALALSSQSGGPETNLEKSLHEDYNDVSTHDSKLAIRRAEAQGKRQRDNENIHESLLTHGLDGNVQLNGDDEQAVNILRRHLFLVQQLQEVEKAAVEEDMISMHRAWLEEEEALKLKQLERRHQDSLQAQDLLLCKVEEKRIAREDDQNHLVAMAAHKETEERKQMEELRSVHKREALSYVSQLKAAAERQRIEDEELQATITATLPAAGGDKLAFLGISKMAGEIGINTPEVNVDAAEAGRIHNLNMAGELSKNDLVNALEGQTRSSHAAQLVDQLEVNRLASQLGTDHDISNIKASTTNQSRILKPLTSSLPFREPYYGRKAVNWYE